MAILDPRSDAVVIRVVYDGAPMAGKTTSVRALGRGLGGEVASPAEVSGRTLYFDWLDYTGGLFEGRRIRCQIISVPGQATLAPRRRRLLESADAIVFVGDSTPVGFAADRSYLSGLQTVPGHLSGPPVGIVFQANKRDHADAVPIDTVRSMLANLGLRVGVVESVATESLGIREAFVFAVRLALDRVRDLMRTGELPNARPDVDSAQELLEDLQRAEEGSMDFAALSGLVHTRLAEVQPDTMLVKALAEAVGNDGQPSAAAANEDF
jgi:signal recognition particle receptor subunit beta